MKNIIPIIVAISMVASAQDVSPASIAQAQAELKLAITAGNINAIQSALNKGAPIDGAFDARFNPLCLASFEGNLDVVKYLLKAGANINWLNEKSNSSLSAALFVKQSEMALYLISQGCDLGTMSKDESNGNLLFAIQSGLTECTEELLKRGVPAECMDEGISDSLAVACQHGHIDIVRLLIKYGFDLKDPRYTRILSPLCFAADKGHLEVVELLLAQGMDCNEAGKFGLAPILQASQAGHASCVAALLAHGANPNIKTRLELVALVSAAQGGHDQCVDILLAHPGIDVNAIGLRHDTALYGASISSPELVQRLLDAGSNPNINNEDGASPLLRLSGMPLPLYQIAALSVMEAGADINARNNEGESPLLRACKENNVGVVEILLALGADTKPKDSTGRSALDYAKEASRAELLALFDKGVAVTLTPEQRALFLQAHRAHLDAELEQARIQHRLTAAIKAGDANLVEEALRSGAQINGLDSIELAKNNSGIFSFNIIGAEKDADAEDVKFDTGEVEKEDTEELILSPLACACALNNRELVSLLLAKGADMNQLIGFECSALSTAIGYGHADLARELVKLGAKPQLSQGNDQSMLSYCLWFGDVELFDQLIKAGAQLDLESYECAATFYWLSRAGKYQEAAQLIKIGFDEKKAERITIKPAPKSMAKIVKAFYDVSQDISMMQGDEGDLETSREKRPSLLYLVSQSGKPQALVDIIVMGALSNGDLIEQKAIVAVLHQEKSWQEMRAFAEGETKNGKNTMILAAASLNSVDALRSCMVTGADINAKDEKGQSALAILTLLGNVEALDLLLEHGADINSRTNAGRTPLILACGQGSLDVVKFLVEHGADIKATDQHGDAARLYALAAGHQAIVNYLDGLTNKKAPNSQWTFL